MEGEVAEASGSQRAGDGEGAEGRRRTLGGQILDQFRGAM